MPTPINISASRGAAILGLSKWSTPVQIWLQIMESREPGFCAKNKYELPIIEYNTAMKWGHAFESAIIELAEIKKIASIVNREKLFSYNNYVDIQSGGEIGYITCHIDGQYEDWDHNLLPELHEGKTTSANYFYSAFGEPGTDRVPVEYQLQCQHQMICTGAEKVILSVLVFPKRPEEWEEMGIISDYEKFNDEGLIPQKKLVKLNDDKTTWYHTIDPYNWSYILDEMGYFHQYEIKSNSELQGLMLEKYSKFWNENILSGKVPEIQDYQDIKSLCREPVGTIIATEEIERFMAEYHNITSEISASGSLAKRKEQIKIEVMKYMMTSGAVIDEESQDKFILRGQDGKKLASYGKDKNGKVIFR